MYNVICIDRFVQKLKYQYVSKYTTNRQSLSDILMANKRKNYKNDLQMKY